MKDIHSHILYGIDDGAKTLDESINIIKNAIDNGITDIVLTPHYISKSKYSCNNNDKNKILNTIKNKLKEENININLYLGNEVMIDKDTLELINKEEISTINNTRYVLIEFSFNYEYDYYQNIIFELVRNNYIPILAHPERYSYIQKDPKRIEKYLEMGVILQGNYLSLFNRYGSEAKKTLKILLKNKQISLLASDIHREKTDYRIDKLNKKLNYIIKDKEYINELLNINFTKIINNVNL